MIRLCVGLLALCTLCGCPYAEPRTEIGYGWGGFKFHNSKDVKVVVKGADYNQETGHFHVDELVVEDNASDVRRANVEQIRAQTEQMQAVTQMITLQTQMMTGMMSKLAPFLFPATSVDVSTPWGGVKGGTTPMPTTQPGN